MRKQYTGRSSVFVLSGLLCMLDRRHIDDVYDMSSDIFEVALYSKVGEVQGLSLTILASPEKVAWPSRFRQQKSTLF
jgi:hypothetical protein